MSRSRRSSYKGLKAYVMLPENGYVEVGAVQVPSSKAYGILPEHRDVEVR